MAYIAGLATKEERELLQRNGWEVHVITPEHWASLFGDKYDPDTDPRNDADDEEDMQYIWTFIDVDVTEVMDHWGLGPEFKERMNEPRHS